MEESGPAVLDRPSPGLSLAPVQQLKRKQGKLHKETSSCSLAALTGGWGDSSLHIQLSVIISCLLEAVHVRQSLPVGIYVIAHACKCIYKL